MISLHTRYRKIYHYVYDDIKNDAQNLKLYKIYIYIPKTWSDINTKRRYLNNTMYKKVLLN